MQSFPNQESLLRLIFDPEHIVNNEVIPAAIPLDDLKIRGYSVDREILVDINHIKSRAITQQTNKPSDRLLSYLSKFLCGDVRNELDENNEIMFIVEASPRSDNEAYAHILSAKKRGDGTLRKLRFSLVKHLQNIIELDKYSKQ
jgi:hypothetical protein